MSVTNEQLTDTFGYLGAVTLTITLMPQLILTCKTKKVDTLSLGFLLLQLLTCVLFLIYGILLNELPLISANSVTSVQSLVLLGMKIKYRNR